MAEMQFLKKPEDKAEKKDAPGGSAPILTGNSYGAMPQSGIGLFGGLARRSVADRISPEITPESIKMHYVSEPLTALQPQGDAPVQRMEGESAVEEPVRETENTPNQTGIPDGMKSRFEAMSGLSFDDVRIHYSSAKPVQLHALAYTQGNQVYVGPGQEKHLPHELGHVVQQKQGRVKPTAVMGKVEVNDDTGMEREASLLGEQAMQLHGSMSAGLLLAENAAVNNTVQMEGATGHTVYGDCVVVGKATVGKRGFRTAGIWGAYKNQIQKELAERAKLKVDELTSDWQKASADDTKVPELPPAKDAMGPPPEPAGKGEEEGMPAKISEGAPVEDAVPLMGLIEEGAPPEPGMQEKPREVPSVRIENRGKIIANLSKMLQDSKIKREKFIIGTIKEQIEIDERIETERTNYSKKIQKMKQDNVPTDMIHAEKTTLITTIQSLILEIQTDRIRNLKKIVSENYELNILMQKAKALIGESSVSLQFKAFMKECDCFAEAHLREIRELTELLVDRDIPERPVMVFESFGNDIDQLINIYMQSLDYEGDTICILGLNRRAMFIETMKPPDCRMLMERLQKLLVPHHDAYVVPITWKALGKDAQKAEQAVLKQCIPEARTGQYLTAFEKIVKDEKDKKIAEGRSKAIRDAVSKAVSALAKGGYELPYFEVRSVIMNCASKITLESGINNVLFRWIDRDAQDDTSSSLGTQQLCQIAENKSPEFLSGVYDWREEGEEKPPKKGRPDYLLQIRKICAMKALNQTERLLRDYYFKLAEKWKISGKFYLPEPTLVMNTSAHAEARGRLVEGEPMDQSHESMMAVGEVTPAQVHFDQKLTVSKPNKKSKETGKSYLDPFEEYIAKPAELVDLIHALQNTRQSAFDNGQWNFSDIETYSHWEKSKTDSPDVEPNETMMENDRRIAAQSLLNRRRYTFAEQMFEEIAAVAKPSLALTDNPELKKTIKEKSASPTEIEDGSPEFEQIVNEIYENFVDDTGFRMDLWMGADTFLDGTSPDRARLYRRAADKLVTILGIGTEKREMKLSTRSLMERITVQGNPGAGNCLFYAIAGSSEKALAAQVREEIVSGITTVSAFDLISLFQGNGEVLTQKQIGQAHSMSEEKRLKIYMKKLAKNYMWGGRLEIHNYSRIKSKTIFVIELRGESVESFTIYNNGNPPQTIINPSISQLTTDPNVIILVHNGVNHWERATLKTPTIPHTD